MGVSSLFYSIKEESHLHAFSMFFFNGQTTVYLNGFLLLNIRVVFYYLLLQEM